MKNAKSGHLFTTNYNGMPHRFYYDEQLGRFYYIFSYTKNRRQRNLCLKKSLRWYVLPRTALNILDGKIPSYKVVYCDRDARSMIINTIIKREL